MSAIWRGEGVQTGSEGNDKGGAQNADKSCQNCAHVMQKMSVAYSDRLCELDRIIHPKEHWCEEWEVDPCVRCDFPSCPYAPMAMGECPIRNKTTEQ